MLIILDFWISIQNCLDQFLDSGCWYQNKSHVVSAEFWINSWIRVETVGIRKNGAWGKVGPTDYGSSYIRKCKRLSAPFDRDHLVTNSRLILELLGLKLD